MPNDLGTQRRVDRLAKARDARLERERLAEWSGPRPLVLVVKMSDVDRCPTHRLDPKHYRPDSTCMCVPPRDESLEPQFVKGEG